MDHGGATLKSLRIILATAALVVAFFLPALAQKVETDYDHSASFSNYHTYCWGQVNSTDPFFEKRIREAVDQVLGSKGWKLVPMDGDVTLTAAAFRKINANTPPSTTAWVAGDGTGGAGHVDHNGREDSYRNPGRRHIRNRIATPGMARYGL